MLCLATLITFEIVHSEYCSTLDSQFKQSHLSFLVINLRTSFGVLLFSRDFWKTSIFPPTSMDAGDWKCSNTGEQSQSSEKVVSFSSCDILHHHNRCTVFQNGTKFLREGDFLVYYSRVISQMKMWHGDFPIVGWLYWLLTFSFFLFFFFSLLTIYKLKKIQKKSKQQKAKVEEITGSVVERVSWLKTAGNSHEGVDSPAK